MGPAAGGSGRAGRSALLAAALVAASVATGCTPAAAPAVDSPPDETASADLLHLDRRIDGDSFVADDGVEYRVGLIDTPEVGACGGDQATARVDELLAGGFTAQPYARDVHGRQVARITTAAGDLGVLLAGEGLADDRYLERFRHEHPAYAAELDVAFAAARTAREGLWRTCWAAEVDGLLDPDPGSSGAEAVVHQGRTGVWACHAAYVHCLPDGPDLDCRDVGHQVVLAGRADPYRLDGTSTTATDGVGCDTFDPWSPAVDYAYYASG